MCLTICHKATKHTLSRLRKTGSIICYKVLYVDNSELSKTPNTIHSPYVYMEYKPGWNSSDRDRDTALSYLEIERKYINYGIHVYTNKRRAMTSAAYDSTNIVVPVRCYKKDFVSGGLKREAVFTRC